MIWQPMWHLEGRVPSFSLADDPKHNPHLLRETAFTARGVVYEHNLKRDLVKGETFDNDAVDLWGNNPAIGVGPVVQELLEEILGPGHKMKDLLFAASGDLRDAATLVNALREKTDDPIRIVMNDVEPYVTMRNVILLLLLGEGHVDAAIQWWYNPVLTVDADEMLKNTVKEKFGEALQNETFEWVGPATDMDAIVTAECVLGKNLDGARLLVSMPIRTWSLMFYCIIPKRRRELAWGEEAATALYQFQKVMANPERQDYNDRRILCCPPTWRPAFAQYMSHGIVGPFHDASLSLLPLKRAN